MVDEVGVGFDRSGFGITLVVRLWIYEGRTAEFEAFERAAARIMNRYGGAVERVVRLTPPDVPGSTDDPPFEVHLVRFPGRAAFEAYRADADLAALAPARAAAIRRTEVFLGTDGPSYST